MKARLESSKKWTQFPQEFNQQIREVLAENFPAQAKAGKFVVEGRIYPEEVLLRVGFVENGRLKQMNVEISMNCSPKDLDATERIMNCVDAAAATMQEYFEQDPETEVEFPTLWKEIKFDGQPLFMQTSSVNTELEGWADKLLGEAADSMVLEDLSEPEDALEKSEFFEVTEEQEKKHLH